LIPRKAPITGADQTDLQSDREPAAMPHHAALTSLNPATVAEAAAGLPPAEVPGQTPTEVPGEAPAEAPPAEPPEVPGTPTPENPTAPPSELPFDEPSPEGTSAWANDSCQ